MKKNRQGRRNTTGSPTPLAQDLDLPQAISEEPVVHYM